MKWIIIWNSILISRLEKGDHLVRRTYLHGVVFCSLRLSGHVVLKWGEAGKDDTTGLSDEWRATECEDVSFFDSPVVVSEWIRKLDLVTGCDVSLTILNLFCKKERQGDPATGRRRRDEWRSTTCRLSHVFEPVILHQPNCWWTVREQLNLRK